MVLLVIPALAAMNLPEPTGYVVDTTGTLKPETVSYLTNTCKDFDSKGKAQIAVCVVNSTQPYSIEQWSIKLAEKWKVGYKGIDNGAILVWAKGDRKVRLEVGRGTEALITDAEANRIVNDVIIPCFKKGDFDDGMVAGLEAIKKEVNK